MANLIASAYVDNFLKIMTISVKYNIVFKNKSFAAI